MQPGESVPMFDERVELARAVLTPQRSGFLASAPHPFTHTLSPYVGCLYGNTTCGLYCYAQRLTNWQVKSGGAPWGRLVIVKENAPVLLDLELGRLAPSARRRLRVFFSSTTDPYMPSVEPRHRLSRQCLEVFAQYRDLDLLVVQTRSPLVRQDLNLLRQIPYAWLSMTVETDDQDVLKGLRGGPAIETRWQVLREAADAGIRTQIAVSPCLGHTSGFARKLLASCASRVIVDTLVSGDGTGGKRTGRSAYAEQVPTWMDETPARRLYDELTAAGMTTGWSAAGFCGIPPRYPRCCS